MGFLPDYFLGVPTVPFIVCTIALGLIAVTAGGEDSPILFLFCAIPGWLLAMFYRWGKWVFQNINWEKLAGTAMMISFWIIGIVIAGVIAVLLFNFWINIYEAFRRRRNGRRAYIANPFELNRGVGGGQPVLRVPPNPNANNRRY